MMTIYLTATTHNPAACGVVAARLVNRLSTPKLI
ncbi:hypothetical protein DFP86_106114 [Paludibacterium purpuratum]|uniref:Uncharacterized protein n=1 Tax=Paludibacterium purpuratum TaxID=1144873 RepID=A0A4R7B5M6_9NEIS|nr:hypothetical protein DFP86_106114 [Paludibacterium purpuratum]